VGNFGDPQHNDRRLGENDWWSVCWLAATIEDVDPLEIRSHWNANEAPRIFALRDSAPQIELGPLYADATDKLDVGPARRIFDLLFLRGTTPEYVLPVATDALISEVVSASRPLANDQTVSATSSGVIEAFLTEYRTWKLIMFETQE
jgi:hypothetical protein